MTSARTRERFIDKAAMLLRSLDFRRVGIRCPHDRRCGFVAIEPTLIRRGRPVAGHCPRCGRLIDLA